MVRTETEKFLPKTLKSYELKTDTLSSRIDFNKDGYLSREFIYRDGKVKIEEHSGRTFFNAKASYLELNIDGNKFYVKSSKITRTSSRNDDIVTLNSTVNYENLNSEHSFMSTKNDHFNSRVLFKTVVSNYGGYDPKTNFAITNKRFINYKEENWEDDSDLNFHLNSSWNNDSLKFEVSVRDDKVFFNNGSEKFLLGSMKYHRESISGGSKKNKNRLSQAEYIKILNSHDLEKMMKWVEVVWGKRKKGRGRTDDILTFLENTKLQKNLYRNV